MKQKIALKLWIEDKWKTILQCKNILDLTWTENKNYCPLAQFARPGLKSQQQTRGAVTLNNATCY